MFLQVALNGARTSTSWLTGASAVPETPEQIAAQARAAVAVGAAGVHAHAKTGSGQDSLLPEHVDALASALRESCPGVEIGLSTGLWAAEGPDERLASVSGWTCLPDVASVNWHEPGAVDLADRLLAMGIGVEAGLFHPEAVLEFLQWRQAPRARRILLEIQPDLGGIEALRQAAVMLEQFTLDGESPAWQGVPVLLHGQDQNVWVVLSEAVRRGLASRIGLEDTLILPDGRPASSNAELVLAARRIMA